MISIKKLKASLAVVIILALVLTPFTGNAEETGQNPRVISIKESLQSPESKISADVKKEFSMSRYVEVLVSMREQVDTTQVASETQAALSAKTPYQAKMASRYAVVDKLQETAERTQTNILKLLETEKGNGSVSDYTSFYIVNMVYVKATEAVINKLAACSEVEKIELNMKMDVDWPEITEANVDESQIQSLEWNIDRVGAPAVWRDFGIDGSGVVIGIIDSGFDYTHEALMTKWRGYNPENPDLPYNTSSWFDAVNKQGMPYDDSQTPHGTHVMGTILGQDPDGEHIIGVAPGAKFIGAKAFTASGTQSNWLLAAGQWMLAPAGLPSNAPDIINNSWGSNATGFDEWYRKMVQAWRAAGILPVFSAGNSSGEAAVGSVSAPGNYPESFGVGATDKNNLRGSFSRRGPAPYDAPYDLKPNISAPGVNIRSSVPGGYAGGWSGTSMAAPHITGTAALLLSYNSALTPDLLEQIIEDTATPLTDEYYKTSPNYGYGNGLVNAYEAVSSITSGIGTIQGKVLKPGVDSEGAVIVHNQTVTSLFSGMEPKITAQISDNISVTGAEVYVKPVNDTNWIAVPMNRISGDYKNGEYSVSIPYMFVEEPGFQYKIRAYDYGGNVSETQVYDVSVLFAIKPGEYQTDFSEYPEGWTMNGDWEWGETYTGVAPMGEKLVATKLNGNYSNNSNSLLITPPIDLSNSTSPVLRFRHWYNTEFYNDRVYIRVSSDYGKTWKEIVNYSGTKNKWLDYSLDLSKYVNPTIPIFVQFQLKSNGSTTKDGWYIDDVVLEEAAQSASVAGEAVSEDETESSEAQFDENVAVPETDNIVLHKDPSEYNYYIVTDEINVQQGLPLDAAVTILETGRTVRTNLADGSYKLPYAASGAGDWTLLAESYGYFPIKERVHLENDQVIVKDYVMEKKTKGSISGRIVNERNNEPVAGAIVKLAEDFNVQPVTTDADGYFSMPELYIGQYTLKVIAPNYKTANLPIEVVEGANTEVNVQLKPFIGSEGELAYDDGTVDNGSAIVYTGDAWVVRMTPSGLGKIYGARVFFWGNDWPVPGGNKASFAVYDSMKDGSMGPELFRTRPIEIVRGEWNDIDLSLYEFATDRDFYMAIYQDADYPNCFGIGMDESSSAGRSYMLIEGIMNKCPADYGNIMLRAKVSYEVTTPVITSPADGTFISSENIDVTGNVGNDSLVKVYVNDQAAGEAQSVDKAFTINVPLTEGENIIKATSTIATGETDPSAPVTVISDTVAPELEVNSPAEGFITNREVVDVSGRVSDNYLEKLMVNGNEVLTALDGSFSARVIVKEDINVITAEAVDKAGNITKVERNINVKLTPPTITDIMPDTDLTVRDGDEVTVSFRSDAIHGAAFFKIIVPLYYSINTQATGCRMEEVADGYYVGKWIVPENMNMVNGGIRVEITDIAGNKSMAEANGKITVIMDKIPPVLIPDTEENVVKQDAAITFENSTEWINAITDIEVNGQSAEGFYTVEPGKITINGSLFGTPGDYQIAVIADGYKDAAVTQTITLLTPPGLTSEEDKIGQMVMLRFEDNEAWRSVITDITVNGQSAFGVCHILKGKITIRDDAFPEAGTYTIVVKAVDYEDAVVIQTVTPKGNKE